MREPADFWFVSWEDGSMERWRKFLPEGIDIVDARPADGRGLNKLCRDAEYTVEPVCDAVVHEAAVVLGQFLEENGALRLVTEAEGRIVVSAGDLERCGVSRMVRELMSAGIVTGWDCLKITRTAVGIWSAEERRVIPLTEDFFGHEQER
jgi:hypothetical protein